MGTSRGLRLKDISSCGYIQAVEIYYCQREYLNSMSLKCRIHKSEEIERICASARWKQDPALCWQCMIDLAGRVKEHKEHIVKVDEFVTRIAKEFENQVEQRLKEKPKAKGEYIQLYDEGENYVERFKDTINKRKFWLHAIITQIIESFTEECSKILKTLYGYYDEKQKHFEELYKSIHDAVELRYGLAQLPSVEGINAKLGEIAAEEADCNPYLKQLKDYLLPPLDLDRNIIFQDNLNEFYSIYELSEKLIKEAEKQDVPTEKQDTDEAAEGEQTKPPLDSLGTEVVQQFQNQFQVLVEELSIGVQYRDPMLSTSSRFPDMNDSLNSILSPQRLSHKKTILQAAFKSPECSPFKENPIKPGSNTKKQLPDRF